MLRSAQPQFAGIHRRRIEFHAGRTVAFDAPLYPHEYFRVDRLRARIAAPDASGDGGHKKETQRTDDQQQGQIDHILRPEHEPENVELALKQIEQHGLAAIPWQPGQTVEDHLRDPDHGPPEGVETPLDAPRLNLLARRVEVTLVCSHFDDGYDPRRSGMRRTVIRRSCFHYFSAALVRPQT
jgi:hypothetical protein